MKYLLIILIVFSSCGTTKTVSEKHYIMDSVTIRREPVQIKVPGTKVDHELPFNFWDSVHVVLKKMPKNRQVIYFQDTTNSTRLSYYLDSLNQMRVKCETLDKSYADTLEHMSRVIREIKETTKIKEPGLWQKIQSTLNSWVWLIVIVGVVVVILKIK